MREDCLRFQVGHGWVQHTNLKLLPPGTAGCAHNTTASCSQQQEQEGISTAGSTGAPPAPCHRAASSSREESCRNWSFPKQARGGKAPSPSRGFPLTAGAATARADGPAERGRSSPELTLRGTFKAEILGKQHGSCCCR